MPHTEPKPTREEQGGTISPGGKWIFDDRANDWVPLDQFTGGGENLPSGTEPKPIQDEQDGTISPGGEWIFSDQINDWIPNTGTGTPISRGEGFLPLPRVDQVGGQTQFADISGGGTGVTGDIRGQTTALTAARLATAGVPARTLHTTRFDGGLVDFLSARDLNSNQFQRLENMRINRVNRLVKRPGETARTSESATALQVLPGMGHIQYRAEWDENNVHVSSHFRTISLVDITGTPVVSIRRNNSINDDAGTFTEFLGSSVWTVRQVVGSSNISFSGSEITKSSGLNIFFPGDLLRVYGSGDNDGYSHIVSATATTITVVETLTTDSNTSAVLIAFPHVSMYAIGGALRISDGNFHDTAPSQWYGHIKRDFWGQGVTYESDAGRFKQPAMKENYNNYRLIAQELVAPIIVSGDRKGDSTSAVNQVAIHIAGTHVSGWPEKSVDTEWNKRDRVTCTFVYDGTQESELGRTAGGAIGLEMGTIITEADARAFMVEVYTGASNASWNRRITSIKLYYKFHGIDVDWYEVEHLEINNGWKGSVNIFNTENTGYWIPIAKDVSTVTGTTNGSGNTGTAFADTAHGLAENDIIYIDNTSTIEPGSLITYAKTKTNNDLFVLPVAPVDSLGVSPASWNTADWCSDEPSTTAVATFYIPFSGEKSYSYFTNTARAVAHKVPAFRWRAAATDGALTLVGNIDTTDDNEQTIREVSRVIELPFGMPDTALLSNSKDVGVSEGDEIMALADYQNTWWVMKERNIHVLKKGDRLQTLAQYRGIGCRWMHSFVVTPFGICVADEEGITLLPDKVELSFPIRATYQALTFFNPILTYSHNNNQLHFIPDTSSVTSKMFTFDMVNRGWMKDTFPAKTSLSNFAEGRHYEPEVMFESGDANLNLVTNSDAWTGATGSTPPDDWLTLAGSPTYTILDLNAVANFDTDVLQIAAAGSLVVFQIDDITLYGPGISGYFDKYPEKFGKLFNISFAYRNNEGGTPSKVRVGETSSSDLTNTGLAGDAVLFSETIIPVETNVTLFQIWVGANGTVQIDDVVVSQLNTYNVKQLNKGTTDETGLIQTRDIVFGNKPATVRNVFLSYKSTDVAVTVKIYLDNQTLPAKIMTLDASSTLVNKQPILLNTTSEVLSLSFESTATDFTIEDIELPLEEITFQ